MPTPDLTRKHVLLGIFVMSGFTGLIYESIWSQYLKLFLGHAAYAQTLVLVMFMAGLAIGSWVVARRSARLVNPLLVYAVVEALIGIMGLGFHRVFVAATDFSFTTVIPAVSAVWMVHLYKWTVGAMLMLPQSLLLGATFPLISASIIRRWPERPGETLSVLYFTNSLGAAVGVLVSGFVLIGMVGLPGTILTAGLINILLALIVWALVREGSAHRSSQGAGGSQRTALDALAKWYLLASFLTGAASFMYELGWIRMLSLVLGSATHSFELMLSAFIVGLAFGGLYVRRRIERVAQSEVQLGSILVIMGCLAALTLPAYNGLFGVMAWALGSFAKSPGGYVLSNAMNESLAALIMVPATFCAGMTLPLMTYALMRRGQSERAIGGIYSANTFGAIAGVGLTVYVLMPLMGLKGVILSGAAIHIGLGLWRLIGSLQFQARRVGVATVAGVCVFGATALGVRLDPMRMTSGVFRTGVASLPAASHVVYLKDGKTATISLVEQGGVMVIATNGKPDAAVQMRSAVATADETTMILAAAIPLSLIEDPTRVANIGFGSGLTTHTLLSADSIHSLDSIEIEPRMVDAARIGFGPRIANVFDDARSRIVFEDAKTFFATSHQPYDLIVSEPSNPWVSGVSSLFSDQYYQDVARHLQPDGYFVQWLQLYETDVDIFASVVKAMAAHFSTYRFYDLDDANVLIIATRAASLPMPSERIFRWPGMRSELDRIGVRSIANLQERQIGDQRALGAWLRTRPVPANSDYFPFVDLNASRLRYLGGSAVQLASLTTLPLPFQALLSGAAAREATLEPAAKSILFRDGQVRQALAIREALHSGKLDHLNPATVASLLLIDLSQQRCGEAEARQLWVKAIWQLSKQTAPYLNPDEQRDIWQFVASSACYRNVPGEHRTWADLFTAVGAHDSEKISSLGAQLLAAPAARTREEAAYLTTVMGAADLGSGQGAQAAALLNAQMPRIQDPGEYAVPLYELWAATRPAAVRSKVR